MLHRTYTEQLDKAHLRGEVERVRKELARLRRENDHLRGENEHLRHALDAHLARSASAGLYGPLEMTAGTCVGPRRRPGCPPGNN